MSRLNAGERARDPNHRARSDRGSAALCIKVSMSIGEGHAAALKGKAMAAKLRSLPLLKMDSGRILLALVHAGCQIRR